MPKLRSLSERKNAGNTKSRLEDFKKLNCVSFQNEQNINDMSHNAWKSCTTYIKIITGQVVTEISPFISRHILAKLVEFYFHTYGFFSENITYSISVCFEK